MRVERMEVFTVFHPVRGYFRFFPTDPKTGKAVRPSVLVKLTTDDGLTGWGEAVPTPLWSYETTQTVVTTLREHLAPSLICRIDLVSCVGNYRFGCSTSDGHMEICTDDFGSDGFVCLCNRFALRCRYRSAS